MFKKNIKAKDYLKKLHKTIMSRNKTAFNVKK